MFEVNEIVRVLEPFKEAFPAEYVIEQIKENGVCVICGDRDFDPKFLERVK